VVILSQNHHVFVLVRDARIHRGGAVGPDRPRKPRWLYAVKSEAAPHPPREQRSSCRRPPLAGAGVGPSTTNPRCRRIFSTSARLSMVAMKRSLPPHSGHSRTSIAKVLCSKSAQAQCLGRVYPEGGGRAAPT